MTIQEFSPTTERVKSKWEVLWLIPLIHTGFGCFFSYDAIGAVSPNLKAELGFSNTQIGLLYSAYSISSVLLSVICGILVDKFGPKKIILVTTIVNSVGTVIVAVAPNFGIMLLGQLLYGIGSAPLYTTVIATLQIWFGRSRKPGFYTTMAICCCAFWLRLGSFLAFSTLPVVVEASNFRTALWVSCGTCVSSLVAALIFIAFSPGYPVPKAPIELVEMSTQTPQAPTEPSSVNVPLPPKKTLSSHIHQHASDLKKLPASYWCIATIFIFAIPSIYSFSAFGTIILEENLKYSTQQAAQITSFISLANAVTSPIIGVLVGRVGFRTIFALLGTSLLSAFYVVFLFQWILPVIIFLGVGLSQSVLDAVIFPSLSLVVQHNKAGVATGFMMLWYDVFLTILPIAIGKLKDDTSYIVTISTLVGIALVTCVAGILLKVADYRAGGILDKNSWEQKIELSPKSRTQNVVADNEDWTSSARV